MDGGGLPYWAEADAQCGQRWTSNLDISGRPKWAGVGGQDGRKWAAIVGLTGRPHWTGVVIQMGQRWAAKWDRTGRPNEPNRTAIMVGAGHPIGAALVAHFGQGWTTNVGRWWAAIIGRAWAAIVGRPKGTAFSDGHLTARWRGTKRVAWPDVAAGWAVAGRPREVEGDADGHAKNGTPTWTPNLCVATRWV